MEIAIVILFMIIIAIMFLSIIVSKRLSIRIYSLIFFGLTISIIAWQGLTQQALENIALVAFTLFVAWHRFSMSMPVTTKARDYLEVQSNRRNSEYFCEKCKTKLSYFRIPKSFSQLMSGGWTCPSCGTELDRNGKVKFKKVRTR